jgi:hypothetical protein
MPVAIFYILALNFKLIFIFLQGYWFVNGKSIESKNDFNWLPLHGLHTWYVGAICPTIEWHGLTAALRPPNVSSAIARLISFSLRANRVNAN